MSEYLSPRTGRRPAVTQTSARTLKLAIFVGLTVMITGLLMMFTQEPIVAVWGAVLILAGGTIAMATKVKELIA